MATSVGYGRLGFCFSVAFQETTLLKSCAILTPAVKGRKLVTAQVAEGDRLSLSSTRPLVRQR